MTTIVISFQKKICGFIILIAKTQKYLKPHTPTGSHDKQSEPSSHYKKRKKKLVPNHPCCTPLLPSTHADTHPPYLPFLVLGSLT